MNSYWQLGLVSVLSISGVVLSAANSARAQLLPDQTLGTSSSIITPQDSLTDHIDGGVLKGTNLFHSFSEFNIDPGRSVYFTNPTGIDNILSRVTGSNPSNILGKLGVLGNANLFLLNPHGIFFGAKASLDINGSFLATTANAIQLGNTGLFSATQPENSTLLSLNPGALFFNAVANQPGVISNRGNLSVGGNLTLAANNLDLEGQLQAAKDLTLQAQDTVRIRDTVTTPLIAKAGGEMLIQGNQGIDIFALNHPASGFFSGKDTILRSPNPVLGDAYYTAANFRIEQLDGSLGNLVSEVDPIIRASGNVSFNSYTGRSLHIFAGGAVNISGNVDITGADAINYINETVTLSNGQSLLINGSARPTLDIRAGTTAYGCIPSCGAITGTPVPFGLTFPLTASSADITIGSLTVSGADGLVYLTNRYSPYATLSGKIQVSGGINTNSSVGNGGSLFIDSKGGIALNGNVNTSSTVASGGKITLIANNDLTTRNINTSARNLGTGGDITLISNDKVSVSGSELLTRTSGSGKAGDINLTGNSVSLTNGAILRTATVRQGDTGSITIKASDSVVIDGESTSRATSVLSEVEPGGTGKAGGVNITARTLRVTNGAQISASTLGNGDAGSVLINASEQVVIDGEGRRTGATNSTIVSQVKLGAVGRAGGVDITTGSLQVTNGGVVSASTLAQGDAGSVTVQARDQVIVAGERLNGSASGIFSQVLSRGVGNSGGVNITTGSLQLTNGGQLSASTLGKGDAGSVTVQATDQVVINGEGRNTVSGILSEVNSNAVGRAGGINITAGSLKVTNGAQLSASTLGTGDAGRVTIQATDKVLIDGERLSARTGASSILSQVKPGGVGEAGGVNITTSSLEMTNGGVISASTLARGNAGSVTVQARDRVLIDGEGRKVGSSGIFSQVTSRGIGSAGGLNITTGSLSLTNGALLSASTLGQGDAGSITVKATDSVVIDGEGSRGASGIFSNVNSTGVGNAGGVNITTGSLNVLNGAQVSATTLGQGNAGSVMIDAKDTVVDGEGRVGVSLIFSQVNAGAVGIAGGVNITTDSLSVSKGAQVSATTFGQGHAGSVSINARESVSVDGISSQGKASSVLSGVELNAVGDGGDISINTPLLSVTNQAQISASTSGTGNAGSILVQDAQAVSLDKGSTISTAVKTGAVANSADAQLSNIQIQTRSLSLTNGASLSASTAGQGNAGDILVWDAKTISLDNSTISTAVSKEAVGKGGNVELQTGSLTLNNSSQISSSTSGTGDTGKVAVQAADAISLNNHSQIRSAVEAGAIGNSQIINLQTPNLLLSNGASLSASTAGQGNAGNIQVQDANTVALDNSSLSTEVKLGAKGIGGNVDLATNSLTLNNSAQISASTSGEGNAGYVTVQAADAVSLSNNSQIRNAVEETAVGNGQEINLQARSLNLTNGAQLNSSTSGQGNAGNIQVKTTQSVNVAGENSKLSTRTTSSSSGGNISIETDTFSISDQAVLDAKTTSAGDGGTITVTANTVEATKGGKLQATTSGGGHAGTITLNSNDRVMLDGVGSSFTTSAEANSTGRGGDIQLTTRSLSLSNGAQLNSSTSGAGDAGNININATGGSVTLANSFSGLLTQTNSATGKGGAITVDTNRLQISDQAVLNASTTANSPGGSITVNANSFQATQGGQLLTTTIGSGKAGDITLNIAETTTLSGNHSGLLANTATGSSGDGGNISIETTRLNLTNGAQVSAQSAGTGKAGQISINATQAFNSNQGEITASATQSGGGNIQITTRDLRLRNQSLISSSVAQSTGGGGDIRIDANTFIALEDSDILANADQGTGGNIEIISPVFLADLFSSGQATAVGRNPGDFQKFRGNNRVDISASSRVGISGSVVTPDFSFLQNSLASLSGTLVDPDQVVARSCLARRNGEQGSFTVTGTGGLPRTPYEVIRSEYTLIGVQSISGQTVVGSPRQAGTKESVMGWKLGDAVQEAQGITLTAEGRVLIGTTPQLVAMSQAEALICQTSSESSAVSGQ